MHVCYELRGFTTLPDMGCTCTTTCPYSSFRSSPALVIPRPSNIARLNRMHDDCLISFHDVDLQLKGLFQKVVQARADCARHLALALGSGPQFHRSRVGDDEEERKAASMPPPDGAFRDRTALIAKYFCAYGISLRTGAVSREGCCLSLLWVPKIVI